MVMPNLYGAIVSNIALGITGGAGLTPGAMIGEKYAIFEVVSDSLSVGWSSQR